MIRFEDGSQYKIEHISMLFDDNGVPCDIVIRAKERETLEAIADKHGKLGLSLVGLAQGDVTEWYPEPIRRYDLGQYEYALKNYADATKVEFFAYEAIFGRLEPFQLG
jgi:hypothetical protein